MMEILREADARLRAWGVEPMRLDNVRQPFDYAPRLACRGSLTRTRSE
jgi:hypothetical protein